MASATGLTRFTDGLKGMVSLGLLKLTAALPFGAVQRLGRSVGRLLYRLPNRNRAVTRRNLALCLPLWDAAKREALVRDSLTELGSVVFEGGPLWLWTPARLQPLLREVQGQEHFQAALARGKGVILVTPHLGNWEILPIWLVNHAPMTALYKTAKLSAVDKHIRASRERLGVEMAAAGHGGVKTLLKSLKAGKALIVLADHEPSRGSGVFVPFFGQMAYSPILVPRLCEKTGAAVVMVSAQRLPDSQGYRLLLEPGPDLSSLDETQGAAALNAAMERQILRFPEQYMWNYKRFRTPPAGGQNPYRDLKS